MVPVIPSYISVITVAANLVLAAGVWWILASAAGRSDLPAATQRTARLWSALFIFGWLVAVLVLAPAPASLLGKSRFYIQPLIPVFALGSFAIVLLLYWLVPAVRRLLQAASLPGLIAVQTYRTVGFVFLILMAQGQLPAHFAEPAGWGDIAVGLTAPFVALALVRGFSSARVLAIGWNLLGMLDLIVAVGMGTGILASLLNPELGRVPAAAAMGIFPMLLVPTFVVPLSLILHVISLARLRRRQTTA
jgi:hypothetical protein